MTAQASLALDTGEPDHERLRAHEADFTPAPVVAQGLAWLASMFECRRFLDPCAGAGVFGQQAKAAWPGLADGLLWAIEPRAEESGNLKRHYHAVETATYQEMLGVGDGRAFEMPCFGDGEPWDVIATNPPFTEFCPLVQSCRGHLGNHGVLMLLGLTSVMQRAKAKVEFCLENPPNYELRIAGPIGFRGPGKGFDQRDYSFWVWSQEERVGQYRRGPAPHWSTYQLPMLPLDDRRWRVKPGSER